MASEINSFLNTPTPDTLDTTVLTNNGSEVDYTVSHTSRIILASAYFIMTAVGIIGNIMVVLAVMLSHKLQTAMNVFVVNLSIADLFACCTFPTQGLDLLGVGSELTWLCVTTAVTDIISLGCSLFTLTLIAINRYILITKVRYLYRRAYTPFSMFIMILFAWLIAPICLILASSTICDVYIVKHDASWLSWLVPILLFSSLITILICYILVFLHIRKHVAQSMTSQKSSRRLDIDVTKNLLCVVCGFFFCVLPYTAAVIISKFSPNPTYFYPVITFFIVVLHINSVINPIIYAARHPLFKPVFASMITFQFHHIPEPSRIGKLLSKKVAKDPSGSTSRGTDSDYV